MAEGSDGAGASPAAPTGVASPGSAAAARAPRAGRLSRRALRWPIRLAVLVLPLWAFWLEPDALVVHRSTVPLPGLAGRQLAGLKIALVSDLHAGAPWIGPAKLDRLVAMVNAEKPDLILLAGDFVPHVRGGHPMAPSALGARLAGLSAPLGVFAVLGNHDYVFNPGLVADGLEANGIRVLEGSGLDLVWRGRPFRLAGVGDLQYSRASFRGGLVDNPPGRPALLLTHNPELFYTPERPLPVSLMLAGHTHGGQVQLPFVGALLHVTSCRDACLQGLAPADGLRRLFVTTGVGTSGLPVRFGVPPEIAVLTLRAE